MTFITKLLKKPAFLVALFSLFLLFVIRPWQEENFYSLLSWDKFGYYLYLPITFIYKNWHTFSFAPEILNHYQPSSYWYQSLSLPNGDQVLAYPIGVAIVQFPFFVLGYLSAVLFNYPLDGFSAPFVFWIYVSGLVYSNIGVYYCYKSLKFFYPKNVAGITLVMLFACTNLLYYCFVDAVSPHSYLFVFYSLLIYYTIRWHQTPTFVRLLKICVCIGFMVSMRATEVIAIIIPLLWNVYSYESLKVKLELIKNNLVQFVVCIIPSSIPIVFQMVYWKYATGHFIFSSYSYSGFGFSFLSPHLWDFFFSYRKGFFMYCPFMILTVFSLVLIFRNSKYKAFRLPFVVFTIINMYVLGSWDVWWYGGCLGQRALVQSYAILVFFLAIWFEWIQSRRVLKLLSYSFAALCMLINISFTLQYQYGLMASDGYTKGMFIENLLYPFSQYVPFAARTETGSWKKEHIAKERLLFEYNMDNDPGLITDSSGKSILIGQFAGKDLITFNSDSVLQSPYRWIRCEFDMKHLDTDPRNLNNLRIVATVNDANNQIKLWEGPSFDYLFKSKKDFGVWKKCQADFEVPANFKPGDRLNISFWMNSYEQAYVRNIKIFTLDLKE